MNSVNCSKPGYWNITCSKIENIPYNLISQTKFNHSLIQIKIISWDYLNLSLATSQYQNRLYCITWVAQGRSTNQIAVNSSYKIIHSEFWIYHFVYDGSRLSLQTNTSVFGNVVITRIWYRGLEYMSLFMNNFIWWINCNLIGWSALSNSGYTV
jgi:hypothetical protein